MGRWNYAAVPDSVPPNKMGTGKLPHSAQQRAAYSKNNKMTCWKATPPCWTAPFPIKIGHWKATLQCWGAHHPVCRSSLQLAVLQLTSVFKPLLPTGFLEEVHGVYTYHSAAAATSHLGRGGSPLPVLAHRLGPHPVKPPIEVLAAVVPLSWTACCPTEMERWKLVLGTGHIAR